MLLVETTVSHLHVAEGTHDWTGQCFHLGELFPVQQKYLAMDLN